jgi:glycerol-3-phosphate dehydrogenase
MDMAQDPDPTAAREPILDRLACHRFDVLVIGGGITGAAIAHRAARGNLSVALVEKSDFASGTSSRSSRLIHGGLRYLKHGHFRLVMRSQREQRRMAEAAPHLVKPLPMLLPLYRRYSSNVGVVSFGMLLYRGMQPFDTLGNHGVMTASALLDQEPLLPAKGLLGGFVCREFLTHDARLVWENVLAAIQRGACAANYVRVQKLITSRGRVCGVVLRDELTGLTIEAQANTVVDATGAWSGEIANKAVPHLRLSKGVHIFVSRRRLPLERALILFSPRDARPIVVIPNENFAFVGPTETEFHDTPNHVTAEPEDISYLLETLNEFFPALALNEADVIDARAGLRALYDPAIKNPGRLSREYHIEWQRDGLLSVLGGKLTLHRHAAEETLRVLGAGSDGKSARAKYLLPGAVWTHSAKEISDRLRDVGLCDSAINHLVSTYGSRAERFAELLFENPAWRNPITPHLPHIKAEAIFSARHEMAVREEDFLERRSDLALSARAAGLEASSLLPRHLWQTRSMKMAASA